MPTDGYVDPALAEQRVAASSSSAVPQCLGLSGDLPEPGSFLTNDDLGIPILATRDADGTFRAFVNAVPPPRREWSRPSERGTKRRFTCPFHAWIYDSAGELVGLPEPEHFGDVDRSCLGLRPLPAEERHGLLFVHPDPERRRRSTLDHLLGEWFDDEFPTWNFDTDAAAHPRRVRHRVQLEARDGHLRRDVPLLGAAQDTLFNGFHGNVQLLRRGGPPPPDDPVQAQHRRRCACCRRSSGTSPSPVCRCTGSSRT